MQPLKAMVIEICHATFESYNNRDMIGHTLGKAGAEVWGDNVELEDDNTKGDAWLDKTKEQQVSFGKVGRIDGHRADFGADGRLGRGLPGGEELLSSPFPDPGSLSPGYAGI
ncbi:hypothetical protein GOP47_0002917 [Adiantum capillus-veneris]|uniref:Uncharacterized protein n=1 Tax=Adiantum capillus-veneris TaxID=13818 RepID=A0A9D4VB86_ADICA|nr:hypothetical protein GOP47_0002917 [Adiantum capillus-veneris]